MKLDAAVMISSRHALALFIIVIGNLAAQKSSNSSSQKNPQQYVGNEACAKCHEKIYQSYSSTPMAHASGLALDNLIPADFTHARSGVHYRIYKEDARAWLSFDRDGDQPLHGRGELLYYIGSGKSRGLTYLFADDGFFFESPINWYTSRRVWDMTPAYQDVSEMPLNLPAHTNCLHCHVSGMRPPLDGTENKYEMPLLAHAGVSCERCHGPAEAHLGGGAIINPAKLPPDRRDAICMQCHMEGRVSVERPGKHIYEFRPGDSLSDYVRYYVLANNSGSLGAVSQVEALSQSTCKKMSGDKMSCTSCHDPHYTPSLEERVSYYRGKCLACHGAAFARKHHPEQQDCTACHMPASLSKDVAHTEVTDHRILRDAHSSRAGAVSTTPQLVAFPNTHDANDDARSFALAWEALANTGIDAARPKAYELLRKVALELPNDPAVLSALGYEEQREGSAAAARDLYQKALALDPNALEPTANLGVIEAQSGNLSQAVELWQRVFDRAPGKSNVGINLARAQCMAGKLDAARNSISRTLEFNPDSSSARRMKQELSRATPTCN